jgi:metal-sulfur cluster biosynthetic enzyme
MTPTPAPEWAVRALSEVYDPCCREKGISVVDMGLLRSVSVADGHARVELLLTSGWCPFAARVLTDVEHAIATLPGVDSCEVEIVWDEAWTTDRLSESAVRKLRFLPDPVAVGNRDAYLATHSPATARPTPGGSS